jgi:hypothetical protein
MKHERRWSLKGSGRFCSAKQNRPWQQLGVHNKTTANPILHPAWMLSSTFTKVGPSLDKRQDLEEGERVVAAASA